MHEPKFRLEIHVRDDFGTLHIIHSFPLEHHTMRECLIPARAVDEMKLGLGIVPFEDAITYMKRREFRRKLFVDAAAQMAHQLCDRMEDSEGWHDASRIEPARQSIGYNP